MNGYLPIRVMIPLGKPGGGSFVDYWSQIIDGEQQRVVSLEGLEVTLPDVYEAIPLGNFLHFAPGVPNDPAKFTPATMEEFRAARAKGEKKYVAWVESEKARKASFETETAPE